LSERLGISEPSCKRQTTSEIDSVSI
jgi:hypothetical protein